MDPALRPPLRDSKNKKNLLRQEKMIGRCHLICISTYILLDVNTGRERNEEEERGEKKSKNPSGK